MDAARNKDHQPSLGAHRERSVAGSQPASSAGLLWRFAPRKDQHQIPSLLAIALDDTCVEERQRSTESPASITPPTTSATATTAQAAARHTGDKCASCWSA